MRKFKRIIAVIIITSMVMGLLSVQDMVVAENSTIEEISAFEEGYEESSKSSAVNKSEVSEKNDLAEWNAAKASMPTTGNVKALVFLVEFQDMKNTEELYTAENVHKQLFSQNDDWEVNNGLYKGSLTEYYQESSFEKLSIDGEVYGWYTATGNRSDYEEAYIGRQKLIREVVEYYDDIIDYSEYDSDKDGYIDALYINYTGELQSWGEQWWSYKSDWVSIGDELVLDGVEPSGFVFLGEKYVINGQVNQSFCTTAIHETGHLLGLPDYYDYDINEGECGGLGRLDMMDGNLGDHNPFSKLMLGWIDANQIKLADLTNEYISYDLKSLYEGGNILIVSNNWTGSYCSEYYLLEYYDGKGLNDGLFETEGGIRIWHVNAVIDDETNELVYNNSYSDYKLLKVCEADGDEEIAGSAFNLGSIVFEDDDLYHDNDTFYYASYPSSDYYNKKFTGINIRVEIDENNTYLVRIREDVKSDHEPQIKSVIPEENGEGFNKNGIYNQKWIRIEFDSVIKIADMEKIMINTLSGKEAGMGDIVVGDNYITFPIYGDETTKAILFIKPGFVENTSNVKNTWIYSYEINSMMGALGSEEPILEEGYTSFQILSGTYYDEEDDVIYALLQDVYNTMYWISIDKEGNFYQTAFAAYGASDIIELEKGIFLITCHMVGSEKAKEIVVLDSSGNILSIYSIDMDLGYGSYYKDIMLMDDGRMFMISTLDGLLKINWLSFDEEYNIKIETEEIATVRNDLALFMWRWYVFDNTIFALNVQKDSVDNKKNIATLYRIENGKLIENQIIIQNEYEYENVPFCYKMIENEDSYIMFLTANFVKDEIFSESHILVMKISKEDFLFQDYFILHKDYCWNSLINNLQIQDIIELDEEGYILKFSGYVLEDSTQAFSGREPWFYMCLDYNFNIKWTKVTYAPFVDNIVKRNDQEYYMFIFDKDSVYELQYEKFVIPEVSTNNFTITNNLSDEIEVREVVIGGKLRYYINIKEGYTYKVYVNGKEVEVENNILIYENTISQSGEQVVQIVYEKAVIYGDANGDGKVTVIDAILIKRYIAGYENLNINLEASNVNGDTKVNVVDAIMIMRHLAGYDVVLGQQQ